MDIKAIDIAIEVATSRTSSIETLQCVRRINTYPAQRFIDEREQAVVFRVLNRSLARACTSFSMLCRPAQLARIIQAYALTLSLVEEVDGGRAREAEVLGRGGK
jgi:hypothetical protein